MCALWLLTLLLAQSADPPPSRPLMAEFMGINGHTVQFIGILHLAPLNPGTDNLPDPGLMK